MAEVDSETPLHFGDDDAQFLSGLANILDLAIQARTRLQRATEAEASAALALGQERTLLDELRHRSKNDLYPDWDGHGANPTPALCGPQST